MRPRLRLADERRIVAGDEGGWVVEQHALAWSGRSPRSANGSPALHPGVRSAARHRAAPARSPMSRASLPATDVCGQEALI